MTRYTVVWYPFPEDELLRLWLTAIDRQAITAAADTIDRELARDATTKGKVVEDDLREFCVPPLCVLFQVSEPDRLVKIAGVKLS